MSSLSSGFAFPPKCPWLHQWVFCFAVRCRLLRSPHLHSVRVRRMPIVRMRWANVLGFIFRIQAAPPRPEISPRRRGSRLGLRRALPRLPPPLGALQSTEASRRRTPAENRNFRGRSRVSSSETEEHPRLFIHLSDREMARNVFYDSHQLGNREKRMNPITLGSDHLLAVEMTACEPCEMDQDVARRISP